MTHRVLHLSRVRQEKSHMARCLEVATRAPLAPTSPRARGEVDLQAEPLRSEANRVRGLVDKLRLSETPPHPDSFAPLRCARNPTSPRARGEVAQVAVPRTSRYQLKCDCPSVRRGEVEQGACAARSGYGFSRTSHQKNTTPAAACANMIHTNGAALVASATGYAMSCEMIAPQPICTQPVTPEAVPIASGRTLTAPAMALGSAMPLPI